MRQIIPLTDLMRAFRTVKVEPPWLTQGSVRHRWRLGTLYRLSLNSSFLNGSKYSVNSTTTCILLLGGNAFYFGFKVDTWNVSSLALLAHWDHMAQMKVGSQTPTLWEVSSTLFRCRISWLADPSHYFCYKTGRFLLVWAPGERTCSHLFVEHLY